MNIQSTKLELIRMITDIQSEKLLESLQQFLKEAELEDKKEAVHALSPEETKLFAAINEGMPDSLHGVAQLEGKELDDFIQQVLSMSARRKAGHLEERESELLELINEGPAAQTQQRFRELDEKRRSETLTEEEHAELIRINMEMEAKNVQRMRYLSELALLRKTGLRNLMAQLGIPIFHA